MHRPTAVYDKVQNSVRADMNVQGCKS